MIILVVILVLVVAVIAGAFVWIIRRETARDGFWADVETGAEGRLTVDLPYLAAGSYHRAVRPRVIRTGPLYPLDLPGLALQASAPFRAGEPGPGGGGSARSSSAAGQSTYQVLYAMASAVNDAWLDRLFAGTAAHRG